MSDNQTVVLLQWTGLCVCVCVCVVCACPRMWRVWSGGDGFPLRFVELNHLKARLSDQTIFGVMRVAYPNV